ncbi:MAG: hypothetical protein Nkreftii_003442 [Candidatus Nitrospira kreftii]|uniref:Uncharacterized protein n=1 Tax=Candidatus Nitrospira kreftii TaxID=2652173 RepID=A0A7S8FGY0_9BACT|nr:MAG: hypothetical protein Nkreftii_003442 [Candidatus Nitrospira kreftii]
MLQLFRYLLLVMAVGGVISQIAWADEPPAPQSLWQTVLTPPPTNQPPLPKKPWMIRDREIALDLPLLHILKDAGARPLPKITVELFDNANPELDVSSTVSRINDTSVVRGIFKPPVQGDFTFVITGNLLIGTIQIGNRLYKTDHIGNGRLRLVELDPDKMPRD